MLPSTSFHPTLNINQVSSLIVNNHFKLPHLNRPWSGAPQSHHSTEIALSKLTNGHFVA